MKIMFLIFSFLAVSIEGNGQPPDWELISDSIEVDGMCRIFEYFTPDNLRSSPALIFVLHGARSDVAGSRYFTNYEFEKIAEKRNNYVIVYPMGYENHWNDCRIHANISAVKKDINDIEFFLRMIDYFDKKFDIDPNSVFATGISNGGFMCYKLASEIPGKIKGIAPFVANIPEPSNNECINTKNAVPVMIINGTADGLVPYEGGWLVHGQDSTRGVVLSTEETLNYWKNLLPCEPEFEMVNYDDINPNDSSTLEHYKYFCNDSKMRVELLKVINGGHTVPLFDTPDLMPFMREILGNTNNDVNSPLLVVDFFESLR
jgi:polyhydroxybutyrate depolymerase